MQERGFVESFNAALEGVSYVLTTQRNMRVHFMTAILILLAAIYLNFTRIELLILCITIATVLMTEVFNTAVEFVVDMVRPETHPDAKRAKDIAAGAVLLTSANAVVVGYLLFIRKMPFNIEYVIAKLHDTPWHITFASLIAVFGLVILGKIVFYKGKGGFLRGGMPSGHAAMSFAMWTAITFLTKNEVAAILSFVLAFLIAKNRVRDYVHSLWEVVAGAILGSLITAIFFQMFM